MDELWTVIAELGIELHPDRISALAKKISGMDGVRDLDKVSSSSGSASHRKLIDNLCLAWSRSPDVSPLEISAALRAVSVTDAILRERESIQLVWSGPDSTLVPIRRTEQVLAEIINFAKKRLFLVSFVAYKVPSVLNALKLAMDRGVELSMLFESSEVQGGKVSTDAVAMMRGAIPNAKIYVWKPGDRERDSAGVFGSVHAKCAVADGKIAFVSSANLTGAALSMNMEMGLLVKGGDIPEQIDRHLEALVTTKIIGESI